MSMTENIWICITSLVLRVMSDDVVKRSYSAPEKVLTLLNTAARISRDAPEPMRAAR